MSNHKWPHSPQPQQAGRIQRLYVRSAHFFHTLFVPSLPPLSNNAENHWAVSGQIVPGMAYLHCPCRDKLYRKRPTFIVRGRTNCTGNVQYVLPSLSVSRLIARTYPAHKWRYISLESLGIIYLRMGVGWQVCFPFIINLWRGVEWQVFYLSYISVDGDRVASFFYLS